MRVAVMYHPARYKGGEVAIRALELARKEFPRLRAVAFGVFPRPQHLPEWVEYFQSPPEETLVGHIYNGSSLYLCASESEGFGFGPAEAMACGCAVVSTDIGGVREYAEHEITALLCPPRNPGALADGILRLIDDRPLRLALARSGHKRIQQFDWERSTDLFERFLLEKTGQIAAGEPRNRE